MSSLRFTDGDFKVEVADANAAGNCSKLLASVEYKDDTYISDYVCFDFKKFEKINNKIERVFEVEGSVIRLSYEEKDFDFELEFVMKRVESDAPGETVEKSLLNRDIYNLTQKVFELEYEISEIRQTMRFRKIDQFGLEVVNSRIKFYASKNGIYMDGELRVVNRFMELIKHMSGLIYPRYETPKTWSERYTFEEALQSAYKSSFDNIFSESINFLAYVCDFCNSVPDGIFVWQNRECMWRISGQNLYKEISKKEDVLVAELLIIYFPRYEVVSSEDVSFESCEKFLKERQLFMGDIKYGLARLQTSSVSGGRGIWWNC
jgi:hypothetical protein